MDASTAAALLRRYLEGNATPEELVLVEQWYLQLQHAGEWRWEEGEKEQWEKFIGDRMLKQIAENESISKPKGRVRYLRPVRWAAAAAIILLLGAGSWYLFLRKPAATIASAQQQRFRNDVAPGANAAVLTLAGGKTILLNDSARGNIGRQGNAAVVNDNGRLSYHALQEKPTDILYNTLTTQRGNQYQLLLPDGSKVWLNAASSITYPTVFTGRERKVTITGEAYFEVAKNDRMPFMVQEGNATVQVLGTHFNMNDYSDGPGQTTTLLEGAVRVSSNNSSIVLQPGQQAAARNAGSSLRVLNDVDIEEVMAWKNGQFLFKDATISSIMHEVARWYDVDVVYEARIEKHFIADIPRNVPLSQLLKLLELTDQVHFRIDGRKITVIQ
ncbi:MAG: FecR domain-containing protein [Bacteroidetes bacterium]|nr:FecR domain-containing protein [Bacteroidota bacterium]